MDLAFSHIPGRHERQLIRRHRNAFFAWPPEEVQPQTLREAQEADRAALGSFFPRFGLLLERAVHLPVAADLELVLELREDLEHIYEETFGLPQDLERERQTIRELIAVIGRALMRIAEKDPEARHELADLDTTREIRFELLEYPLVADLISCHDMVTSEDVVPMILGASLAEVEAALTLFDLAQCAEVVAQAEDLLLDRAARGVDVTAAQQRLDLFRDQLPTH